MKKVMLSLISVVLITTLFLGACSSAEETGFKGPGKLTVVGSYVDYIDEQYVNYYRLTHDQIEVELHSFLDPESETWEEPYIAVKKMLEGENAPDVLFIDVDTMAKLAEDGYLQPIDTLAKNKKYDLESFVPTLMEYVKKKGNGTLYGIPLTFYSTALFYNKDLFDAAQVPYPEDHMSWDQIYDLARQLSSGEGTERIYGLSFGYSLDQYLFLQAAQRDLTLVSDDLKTVTLDTPEWRQVWEEGKALVEEGVIWNRSAFEDKIIEETDHGPAFYEPFIAGKVAMELRDSYSINNLDQEFTWYGDDVKPFEWDLVTLPTQANNPGYGGMMMVNDLLVINKNTSNIDLAWDFVSYIAGDDLMKLKSKSDWNLSTRTEYLQQEGKEINYDALYTLEPLDNYFPFPSTFMQEYENWWNVLEPLDQAFEEAMSGKKDVDTIIEETQKKMQTALDQVIEEKEQVKEQETEE